MNLIYQIYLQVDLCISSVFKCDKFQNWQLVWFTRCRTLGARICNGHCI